MLISSWLITNSEEDLIRLQEEYSSNLDIGTHNSRYLAHPYRHSWKTGQYWTQAC